MKTARTKRFIISLILSGFMLPYVSCIQAKSSWWWADPKESSGATGQTTGGSTKLPATGTPANPSTKTGPSLPSLPGGSFLSEEAEIMAEVMPTLVRKLIYTMLATAFVSYIVRKPTKLLFKSIMPGFMYDFLFKDDDDNDPTQSKSLKHKISNPKTTINDLADKKLPKDMEDHIKKTENEFEKQEIKKQAGRKIRKIEKRHIILYGPTGSGKTFSVEAYANELGKTFDKEVKTMTVNASNIIDKYVGETPKLIRKLAKDAAATSKSFFKEDKIIVIVMNEFDSLFMGKKGEAEYGQTAANEFQNTLDEDIDPNKNIFFVGTTNRISEIPSATRNRFKLIEIESPATKEEIKKHLEHYLNDDGGDISEELEDILDYTAEKLEEFSDKLKQKFEEIGDSEKTDIFLNRRDLNLISRSIEDYILLRRRMPTQNELNVEIKSLIENKGLTTDEIYEIISEDEMTVQSDTITIAPKPSKKNVNIPIYSRLKSMLPFTPKKKKLPKAEIDNISRLIKKSKSRRKKIVNGILKKEKEKVVEKKAKDNSLIDATNNDSILEDIANKKEKKKQSFKLKKKK